MFEVTRRHIAIDVETGGLNVANLPLLSIGLVEFNPFTGESIREDTCIFSLSEQINCSGKHIDRGTMQWWREQSDDARKVLEASLTEQDSIFTTLLRIEKFCHTFGQIQDKNELTVWASDLVLDFGPLESFFLTTGVPIPWSYNKRRCLRTLKEFTPWQLVDDMTDIGGTKHDALDDARYCAITASRLLRAHRLADTMLTQQG